MVTSQYTQLICIVFNNCELIDEYVHQLSNALQTMKFTLIIN